MRKLLCHLFVVLIVAGMLLWPAGVLAAPDSQTGAIHVVQWGETLVIIAAQYGVTVQDLASANGLVNPNLIVVGQKLLIPAPDAVAPAQVLRHTVARGETLASIADQYGTTVQAIVAANGIGNSDLVYVGQELVIPGGQAQGPGETQTSSPQKSTPNCAYHYAVQSGDTLSGVAWRFGTTTNVLMQANNLYNEYIQPGQELCVPPVRVSVAVQSTPAPAVVPPTPQAVQPVPPGFATPAPFTPSPPEYVPPAGSEYATPVPEAAQPPASTPPTYYVVQPGDTLATIALGFGVSQAAIMQANNLSHPSVIYAGQSLVIPIASQAPGAPVHQIAFSRWVESGQYDLYTALTDGSQERLLLVKAASPSWSPDGRQLAFYGTEGVDRQEFRSDAMWALWDGISNGILILDVAGLPADLMSAELYQVEREATGRMVTWSPDGLLIAWDANLVGQGYRTYFGAAEDVPSDVLPRTDIPGEQPAWSPDGQLLVYRSGRDNKQGLWISNRYDSQTYNVTVNGTDSFPAWSPDGQLIAFHRTDSDNTDIYTMYPDGSNIRRLTTAPGPDTLPAWTPDGRIVFRSQRTGTWGIYIMNVDGSGQQQIIAGADPGKDWGFGHMDVY